MKFIAWFPLTSGRKIAVPDLQQRDTSSKVKGRAKIKSHVRVMLLSQQFSLGVRYSPSFIYTVLITLHIVIIYKSHMQG